jgi:hypothetical protein
MVAVKGKYFLSQTIGKCLGCGRKLPSSFLDLGKTPLANSYLPPEKLDEQVYYSYTRGMCGVR